MRRTGQDTIRLCAIGVVLAFAGAAIPASAGLVVASSGPSAAKFPKGRKLDDDSWITLAKGDTITVLDRRGTRVLRGPGRFSASKTGRSTSSSIYSILTKPRTRVATAVVRTGSSGQPLSPNLWFVDLTASGPHCLADPQSIQAWRPDNSKSASYALTASDKQVANLTFGKGSVLAEWDSAAAPASPTASYAISGSNGKPVRTVTFAIVPQAPASPEDLATLLIEKGCTAQLALLSDTLAINP